MTHPPIRPGATSSPHDDDSGSTRPSTMIQCPICSAAVVCSDCRIGLVHGPIEILGEAAICPSCGYGVVSPLTRLVIDALANLLRGDAAPSTPDARD